MDELLKYQNDAGPVGDLARELLAIMRDYEAGELTLEEKNELVEEVTKIYAAHDHADKEIIARWAVNIAQTLAAVV